jgi:hypothetical protein
MLGHTRPGGDLHLSDQVVYAALVQHMRPAISNSFGVPAASRVYSYHLRADSRHTEWFESFFPRWRAFDRDSVRAIDEGTPFVVVADVAGYYENIDLNTLRSDLNGLGVDAPALSQLMDCLHRWPRVQRRGVPQGYSPSDILAKLYLLPVDLTLAAEGFQHRRWVDDFRIFCATEAEARRALMLLTEVLGHRGLVLQTAKSSVLSGQVARQRFDEVHALLEPIQIAVAQQLAPAEGGATSDLPPWALDEILEDAPTEEVVEILRQSLHAYFLLLDRPFNKSLFHYLLRRLAAARDSTYAAEIIRLLRNIPQEFDWIAAYCTSVEKDEDLERAFIEMWDAQLFPSPYSVYQFLRWRVRQERGLSGALRTLIRRFALGSGHPWYVRAVARATLGKFGDPADLQGLEAAYANAASEVEKAELLCALQRMETGRRNALFGRAAGDGDLASKAVRLARGGNVSWMMC